MADLPMTEVNSIKLPRLVDLGPIVYSDLPPNRRWPSETDVIYGQKVWKLQADVPMEWHPNYNGKMVNLRLHIGNSHQDVSGGGYYPERPDGGPRYETFEFIPGELVTELAYKKGRYDNAALITGLRLRTNFGRTWDVGQGTDVVAGIAGEKEGDYEPIPVGGVALVGAAYIPGGGGIQCLDFLAADPVAAVRIANVEYDPIDPVDEDAEGTFVGGITIRNDSQTPAHYRKRIVTELVESSSWQFEMGTVFGAEVGVSATVEAGVPGLVAASATAHASVHFSMDLRETSAHSVAVTRTYEDEIEVDIPAAVGERSQAIHVDLKVQMKEANALPFKAERTVRFKSGHEETDTINGVFRGLMLGTSTATIRGRSGT